MLVNKKDLMTSQTTRTQRDSKLNGRIGWQPVVFSRRDDRSICFRIRIDTKESYALDENWLTPEKKKEKLLTDNRVLQWVYRPWRKLVRRANIEKIWELEITALHFQIIETWCWCSLLLKTIDQSFCQWHMACDIRQASHEMKA